ncbi:MAG: patatin-like phospholipase family protein [Betaproteobacteria bacterium]|nr:patatin-like phospholipase family protein [Betaproteobacteria bacterium]
MRRQKIWRLGVVSLALCACAGVTAGAPPVPATAATAAAAAVPAVPAAASAASAAASPRPKVGLVLGGGGARGAAHLGVLEVLEELRVPVDCVAGTSMGALVAGAWAAGITPAQMREELTRADWADMFQDNPDYAELNHRNKRLMQRFLPGTETGLTAAGAVTPPGVVSAQKIKLFFNRLVRADAGERRLEELPLPVSIIATDIGTGARVVLREGSLTLAMRASMSVPGLMAPLEWDGRKLVDGGLVDNLPVREVRERCGAEVVIAVNVGSTPLPPEEVKGLLTVSAQVIALLTEQNVQATLAALAPEDVVITPDLGPITAADFERHAEAALRGRSAARASAAKLSAFSVDEATWARWRASLAARAPDAPPAAPGALARPRIDDVQVIGLSRVSEAVVRRYLAQTPGEPLDTRALDQALGRVYGDGWYERVDYSVVREGDRHVLRVMPVEKGWGPDYLRLGMRLDSNLSQGSTYQLRAGYHRTWLWPLGAELLVVGDLGSNTGASVEWLQPLTADRLWFADFVADYRRERSDYFFVEQRIAEYRSVRRRVEVKAGLNLSLAGTLAAGWRQTHVNRELETGIDILAPVPERGSAGWVVAADLDRLDRLYFPRSGWSAAAEWFHGHAGGGAAADADYARASVDLRGAMPWRDYVLASRLTWVGSPTGRLPIHDAGRLGGFLNLTAFASGQLIGDDVAYAHVRAERIIGRLPLGLRGDMRFGVAFESGKVALPFTVQKRNGWLHSLAAYLGGETPLGAMYLGIGFGSGRSTNAYLVIGTP